MSARTNLLIPVTILLASGAVMLALAHARGAGFPPARPHHAPNLGDPLEGLSDAELALFDEGKTAFNEEEEAEDGLGPVFTNNSCGNCHSTPAAGGGSEIVETRIGRWVGNEFDPLTAFGGPLIQNQGIGAGTGVNGPYDFPGEIVPPQATVVSGRRSTPLFGLGLVEAVPDETFKQLAKDQADHAPEAAGRPHFVTDLVTNKLVVGRFGWKAQRATLFDFAGDAYVNELGITTPLMPDENCPQGDCNALSANPLPNGMPNTPDNDDLTRFANFMRFLAPPPRTPVTRQTGHGERLFEKIGCAVCHVPELTTGHSTIQALRRRPFHPYSDFLLHDMGTLGDGSPQGDAGPREMRTAPLWGLAAQKSFLHDGRATTLEEAILAHDGQGQHARQKFQRLSDSKRRALVAFLESL